jgi:hypothetical protein
VIRDAHAGERAKAAAALEAGDAPERRTTTRAKRALASTQVGHLHGLFFFRHGHLSLAPEKYDPHPDAAAHGTGPNRLTRSVEDAHPALTEARQAAHEQPLGDRRRLLAVP